MAQSYRAIGLISGTAHDAIDAALIETDGYSVSTFGPVATLDLDADFRTRLSQAMATATVEAFRGSDDHEFKALEHEITARNAELVHQLLHKSAFGVKEIDLIGFHGQTILHRPDLGLTWQLGDGALLAEMTGIPVVNEFRLADMAAGGQGAPFAPAYHQALINSADVPLPVAILNLGGVGNVTYIAEDGAMLAFDTGPANALLDDWVKAHGAGRYDPGGAIAAMGSIDQRVIDGFLKLDYFLKKPPKSLDRNDFQNLDLAHLGLEDGAATLTALTVASMVASLDHLPEWPKVWYVTGGGRHNQTMMKLMAVQLSVPVKPVEALGWRGDSLEAEAFAFLAVRSKLGLPLSYPGTTAVPRPMTGGNLWGQRY